MTTITLSIPPELLQVVPSDPDNLARVLTLGLQQWQTDYSAVIDLTKIEQLYSLRRPTEVKNFLKSSPYLIETLQTAYVHLQNCFGSNVRATLEVINDPEVDEWRTLFVYILNSLPVDEALSHLSHFDEEWIAGQPDRIQDQLTFNLEFV